MKTYLFTGRIARNLVVMTCLATLAAILLFAIAVSVAGEASDSIARGDPLATGDIARRGAVG